MEGRKKSLSKRKLLKFFGIGVIAITLGFLVFTGSTRPAKAQESFAPDSAPAVNLSGPESPSFSTASTPSDTDPSKICKTADIGNSWSNPFEKILCGGAEFTTNKVLNSSSTFLDGMADEAIKVNYDSYESPTTGQGQIVTKDLSPLTKALSNKDDQKQWVQTLYRFSRDFFNLFLVILLILFAFFNIFHYNIDNYAIKKMLPKILATAIVANISMQIFALASRFTDTLGTLSIFQPNSRLNWTYLFEKLSPGQDFMTIFLILVVGFVALGIGPLGCGISILVFLGAVIAMILLNLILIVRPFVIMLGAAVSPLAIACSILPQTQQFFKRWLGIVVPWMFMPLIVWAIVWVGHQIPVNTVGIGSKGTIAWLIGIYLPILIRAALLVFAIRFPFTVEKDITNLLSIVGKWTSGKAAGLPGWFGGLAKNPSIRAYAERRPRINPETNRRPGWAPGTRWQDKAKIWSADIATQGSKQFNKGINLVGARRREDIIGRLARAIPFDTLPLNITHALDYRKQILELAQKREKEEATIKGALGRTSFENQYGSSLDDSRDDFKEFSPEQLAWEIGLKAIKDEKTGKIQRYEVNKELKDPRIKELFPWAKYRGKFITALKKGMIEKADILAKEIPEFKDFKPDVALEKAQETPENLEKLFIEFMNNRFVKIGSKKDMARNAMALDIEEVNDFTDLVNMLKTRDVKARSRTTPDHMRAYMWESPEQTRARLRERMWGEREERERRRREAGEADEDDEEAEAGAPMGAPVSGAETSTEGTVYQETAEDTSAKQDKQSVADEVEKRKNLAGAQVELSPESILEITNALRDGLKGNAGSLAAASRREFSEVANELRRESVYSPDAERIMRGLKNNDFQSTEEIIKHLPPALTNRLRPVLMRGAVLNAAALQKASASEEAQSTRILIPNVASRFNQINADSGAKFNNATNQLALHENGQIQLTPVEENRLKVEIAQTLGVGPDTVSGQLAQKAYQAYEALKISSYQAGQPVDPNNPRLQAAIARQVISDQLQRNLITTVGSALKQSLAQRVEVPIEVQANIQHKVQALLETQLQMSPRRTSLTEHDLKEWSRSLSDRLIAQNKQNPDDNAKIAASIPKIIASA